MSDMTAIKQPLKQVGDRTLVEIEDGDPAFVEDVPDGKAGERRVRRMEAPCSAPQRLWEAACGVFGLFSAGLSTQNTLAALCGAVSTCDGLGGETPV